MPVRASETEGESIGPDCVEACVSVVVKHERLQLKAPHAVKGGRRINNSSQSEDVWLACSTLLALCWWRPISRYTGPVLLPRVVSVCRKSQRACGRVPFWALLAMMLNSRLSHRCQCHIYLPGSQQPGWYTAPEFDESPAGSHPALVGVFLFFFFPPSMFLFFI